MSTNSYENEFIKLTDNIYYMTPGDNDRPTLGYFINENFSLMIDSGNSPVHAEFFISELDKHCLKHPDYIILTHWHWDHIFGSSTLKGKIISHSITSKKISYFKKLKWTEEEFKRRINNGLEIQFCKDNMNTELSDISSNMIKSPELTFKRGFKLSNDNECEIFHIGGDHSKDSIVVYFFKEKIAFIGDCIYMNIYAKAPYYTINRIVNLLIKLLSLNADCYVDSHSEKLIYKSDIKYFLELIKNLSMYTPLGKNILLRNHFPDKVDNEFCNDILEVWNFFINY
jgi:glyoxylase-like metal-dependent hydrolase (beta-lactamase superfamily II)